MASELASVAAATFVRIERLYPDRTFPQSGSHSHPVHELIYVVRGTYSVESAARRLRGRPGDAFWYPPRLPHAGRFSVGPGSEYLGLQWRMDLPPRSAPWPRQVTDRTGRIVACLTWLFEGANRQPPLPRPLLDAMLRTALLHLSGSDATAPRSDQTVARVLDWCRHHLHEKVSLADLAATAGCTRSHLVRRFHAATGTTPMRHLQRMRLEAAVALLADREQSLRSVALRCGFVSAPHLCRSLKTAGLAPHVVDRD